MNTAHGRLSLFDGIAELLGKRQFEAAKPNRLRTVKRSRTSIDADTRRGAQPIREAARWLEQNYDLAAGALDVLVRNVVGTGILPEPLVRTRDGDLATDFNAELSEWFSAWAMAPEVTGELDYAAAQRLRCLTLFRDGEVFTQYLAGNVRGLQHGSEVPFSNELIEPDQVPLGVSDPRRGIVQGIGKNDWGKPTLYLVAKPDTLGVGSAILTSADYREIPAARIQHLKPIRRIRQTRGVSVFACAIERLEDIRSYDESERVAAMIAASLAAYIKRGSPDFYDPKNAAEKRFDADGNLIPREHKLRPGMIFDFLEIGEEIGTIDTNRPHPQPGPVPRRPDSRRLRRHRRELLEHGAQLRGQLQLPAPGGQRDGPALRGAVGLLLLAGRAGYWTSNRLPYWAASRSRARDTRWV